MLALCNWLSLLLLFSPLGIAKIFQNFDDLPGTEFDYVVVGGGTAGNVIANRLTEDSKVSVLVLEAGGSNEGILPIQVPFLGPTATPGTPQDWNYTTTPQSGLNGRSIPYPRGFVLGGSSSVNYMVYTRGPADDFDRFAKVTGDPGWSWSALQPYIAKNEKLVPPADNHDTEGQLDPAVHSTSGINSVSLAASPSPIDGRIVQTTQQLPKEFPFNLDMNSGNPLGLGWGQFTINDGARSSSATSYLGPSFINRPGLNVLINARVGRLLKSGTDHGRPAFRTVEFKVGGSIKQVTARKEIILSAGAVGSPQVLLNSGIGKASDLLAVGVDPIVDLPDVGANLVDHSLVFNIWSVNSTDTFEKVTRDPAAANASLTEWMETHNGFFSDTITSHLVWSRLPKNSPILQENQDSSSGPHSPHYELIFSNGFTGGPPPATGNFISIITALASPLSRGSVKLKSSDPYDTVLIDPGLLSHPADVATMVEAIKAAKRFLTAPAWKDYIIRPIDALQNVTSDSELAAYARAFGGTVFHPVASCSMSSGDSHHGVVDPDLRVKKITGLRVVDASVLPYIPAAHTQAPTYILAERASDLIKAA